MTETSSSTAPTPAPAPDPRPWQATIQAGLTRAVGVDQVQEVDYQSDGQFTQRLRVVNGPEPQNIQVLQDDALEELLTTLRAELDEGPSGVDPVGLRVFIDLIEDALRTDPGSTRFDRARFGTVAQDGRGILFGHLVLGVDVAGTVRDVGGSLSFEQHVVVMPAGAYRPLSAADRSSLAKALAANPPADPLWQRILADARS